MTRYHTTVRLTASLLIRRGACSDGLIHAIESGVLPATISTDPEQNIALALKHHESERDGTADIRWLAGMHVAAWPSVPYNARRKYYFSHPYNDPMVSAQWLAHVADELALKRERERSRRRRRLARKRTARGGY